MGLAPYGEPKYVDVILSELIDLKEDGSYRLNMEYFNYCVGLTMTNGKFDKLFGGPPREPETNLTQKDMDLARSIQVVTEEVMLRSARHIHKATGEKYLCLAGGVALNCVGNGRILRDGPFEDIWIQPAAGDAGGALGAALFTWHQYLDRERVINGDQDFQKGSFLGPSYTPDQIKVFLDGHNIPYKELSYQDIPRTIADIIAQEKVVGWFEGRMEFGPRALGARSIIGDARSPKMQAIMNLKIKFREGFRPFAPSVLRENVADYFEFERSSPYMLLVAYVRPEKRREMTESEERLWGIDKLNIVRSEVPAITHIDYSARLQTVHQETNPLYHGMIKAFKEMTGCPVIVNTSFNVRGEPIVCSPKEAYVCFMRTHIDYLVMENFILDKREQKPLANDMDWKKEFELD
jgi:carbamoyltransferase